VSIEVHNITKTFGGFTALRGVSLRVPDGELVALLGPSGSGKTTLLRIIAGLEAADPGSGAILFHGQDVAHSRVGERRVGFVFQHYALFRHMTVLENVAFGLRVRPRDTRPSRADIRRRVLELLRLVQLESQADRYPSQLSGGQRQRVALARALAVEPRVLLLDEPFGALDAKVRQGLRRWLRKLHDEIHVTSVFVTHDQEEALEVADRVVVMNQGQVEQVGTPEDVFHRPANAFVMDFLGNVNLFHGRVEDGRPVLTAADAQPVADDQALTELAPGLAVGANGKSTRLFVRPHELEVLAAPDGQSALRAAVARINAAGAVVKIELTTDAGQVIQVEMPHEQYRLQPVAAGAIVFVRPRQARVFDQDFSI
jgi:sulfate/thiosulfate transport system ATP-binding protein